MADKIYTTVLGDTWDTIAYKLFGDSKLYNPLLELNQEYSDVVMFEAGIKIKYQDNVVINNINDKLPPWRK